MKIICAWCGRYLGCHGGEATEDESHGICLPCMFLQSPEIAVLYRISKHPEDVPAMTLAVILGVFLCAWAEAPGVRHMIDLAQLQAEAGGRR